MNVLNSCAGSPSPLGVSPLRRALCGFALEHNDNVIVIIIIRGLDQYYYCCEQNSVSMSSNQLPVVSPHNVLASWGGRFSLCGKHVRQKTIKITVPPYTPGPIQCHRVARHRLYTKSLAFTAS